MTNRLANETSPYLLQHAHNPVDWFPWGDEALNKARAEQRPILLSIGYSACHWCHVMERESFEDEALAAQMNRDFVCIKVDREERPDLDEIYMRAVQAFSGGHGGWPMTVFLTPDGEPFWGGTYFPPQRSGQMPGFDEVMTHTATLWKDAREQVDDITEKMVDYLHRGGRMPIPDAPLAQGWLARVAEASQEAFDDVHGGFGGAPKFPPHGVLATLLAHWQVTGASESMAMATATLDGMARGGTYDQLAGGFARYSVDGSWTIPHFEKMLYDNAQLIPVYLDAWLATANPHYRRVVEETSDWLLREMQLDNGGFAASTDADSEGVEGKYFVWTPAQLNEVLGDAGPRVAALCQVTPDGNFEDGQSVLRLEEPLERMDADDAALLRASFPKLLQARSQRIAPGRDDKVVTSWNAMAVSALARAGAALDRSDWVQAALGAATFLLEQVTVDGRLMRTYKDGRAHVLAYADDHANLISACIDVYEATFDQQWLVRANNVADALVGLFWDEEAGALFYTGSDAGALVTRSKNVSGGAEPSANGSAALAFVRLSKMCGRKDLAKRAEVIVKGYQLTLQRVPRALGVEALAGHWLGNSGCELGVVGDPDHEDTAALIAEYRRRYTPFGVLAARRKNDTYHLLPWMRGKAAKKGATAYLCEGRSCRAPTKDPATLGDLLDDVLKPDHRSARAVRVHAPAWPTQAAHWLNAEKPPALEALRGQVVVLDFWTYCCINCLHVLPELHALEAHFAGQPVAVVGIHSAKFDGEKQRENVAAAVSKYGVQHPVLLDPEHAVWSAYAVKSWPTVVVLDAKGRVAWQQSGEVSRKTLIRVVDGLLAEAKAAGELADVSASAPTAPITRAGLRFPGKVAVWPSDAVQNAGMAKGCSKLYIADSGNGQVLACSLKSGRDGWPIIRVKQRFGGFVDPQGMSRWGEGLYVADAGSHQLKRIDMDTGDVVVLAGTGDRGQGGQASDDPLEMDLRSPWDVAISGQGGNHVVLVAMAGAHQIWVYLPDENRFGPMAGSGREDHVDGSFAEAALAQPSGLALSGSYLFFADSEISSVRALDLQERVVATVVGKGLFDFGDVDGPANETLLQHPLDVTAGNNTVYVADTYNHKIKAIDLQDGSASRTLAGGPGQLWEPSGVDLWGDFLIVADTNNHRVVAVHRKTGELRPLPIKGL